jgi:hypothetical protein
VGEDRPRGVVEVDRRLLAEQVLVALPVRVDRADVAPVALEARLPRAAGLHEPREQRVAEVLVLVQLLERLQQRLRAEDEDLVGDEVAFGLVGLELVADHLAALDLDDAVAAGVLGLDLGRHHGDRGAGVHVLLDQRTVVLRVDRVGAEHDQRLGRELADQRRVAPQQVGRAAREAVAAVVAEPRLEREQPADRAVEVPRPPVGEVVAERDRVELLGDPDVA